MADKNVQFLLDNFDAQLNPKVQQVTRDIDLARQLFPAGAIAKACHEANRVLTAFVKDVPMQPPWDCCGADMQESCVRGVMFALQHPDATPEDQHNAWVSERLEQGWVLGEVKDVEKKTHPALRPYAELSEGVRLKDAVFRAIVGAFR